MDIDMEAVLTELDDIVRNAKKVVMSSSAMIPRDEVLDLIGKLREAVPLQNAQAKEVTAGREKILSDARDEAAKILEDARQERTKLLGRSELIQHAQSEAKRIVSEAE